MRLQQAVLALLSVHGDRRVSALLRNESTAKAWTFDGAQWVEDDSLLHGLEIDGKPVFTSTGDSAGGKRDRGVRLRDLDRDGRCELIVGNESQNAAFSWSEEEQSWKPLAYALPPKTAIVDAQPSCVLELMLSEAAIIGRQQPQRADQTGTGPGARAN